MQGGPGGPALADMAFRAKWIQQPSRNLVQYIAAAMPPGGAQSLDSSAYAEVTAHILRANGAVLGQASAPASEAVPAAAPKVSSTQPPVAQDAVAQATQAGWRAKLDGLATVTDKMLQTPSDADWLHWRNTYDAGGFSNLGQINRGNVKGLRVAWSYQLAPGTNEVTPLVHGGVMFVSSAGRLEALDAATGDRLWAYARPGLNGVLRNLAIYGDLIYLAAETSIVALDMRTGNVVWDRLVAPAGLGVRFGAGPIAANGRIFAGLGYCVARGLPGGCFIVGLDAKTGEELWRFNTIARPGKPGGESWNGPLEERFGSSVWLAGSYDPELDLLYFGTGQTYQTGSLMRGRDRKAGLYTDTTLALRPATGELAWHYQHLDGDVWDLDWSFERTLASLTIDGKPRRTVTTAGKLGIFDTLDAATGKYLFSVDAGIQSLVTGIDPATGAKRVDPALLPEAGVTKRICPAALGGRNWMSSAFNPKTGILYVPLNATCGDYSWHETHIASALSPLDQDALIGRVQAIDLNRRKTLWVQRGRAPQTSAILATAGGLIFEGSRDRWLRARDDRNGKVLWRTRLDSSVSSFPITYSVNGVQHVALAAGGGGSVDALVSRLTPEIATPTGGTTLWVFRLPEGAGR